MPVLESNRPYPVRSHLSITLGVWRALLLREALTRLTAGRAQWFWLLLEPVFHAAYLISIFTAIRIHSVGGIETTLWITVGLLSFFMFRRTAIQTMHGISANKALFSYRQVKPVDTVLVRSALELFTSLLVFAIILSGMGLFGFAVVPAEPLAAFEATAGLWLLGTGVGLIGSVAIELLPELGRLITLAMTPLYFASGIMFAPASVPQPYRGWLLLNPIVHGLDAVRLGFAPHYHAAPEQSMSYLFGCGLITLVFGLGLHRRYEWRLAAS